MGKQKVLIAFILFFICITTSSQVNQSWVKQYSSAIGQGYANDLILDNQGNVYITGFDFNTVKYNSSGEQIWTRQFIGSEAKSIITDAQGNIYITGNDNFNSIRTVKYNPAGEQLWMQMYTVPENRYLDVSIAEIAIDNTGSLYIASNIYLDSSVKTMGTLTLKYNTNGVFQWAKNYNYHIGYQWAESFSITTDNLGNAYVTGLTFTGSETYDLLLIKYSSAGNEEWERIEDGPAGQNDFGRRVKISESGDIYIGGAMAVLNGTILQFDIVLIKYTANGTRQWIKFYDGTGYSDVPYDMAFDNTGNILITGYTGNLTTYLDMLTLKFNSSGTFQWAKSYNGSWNNWDNGTAITSDNAGNIYVTGTAWESSTDLDYTTIKYSQSGEQLWMMQYDGGYIDAAHSIAVDNSSNVYVTGYSSTRNGTSSATTIKYSQLVGINPASNEIPAKFNLYQNYPNPFNPETSIKFDIPVSANVKLIIYDMPGNEVETLITEKLNPGTFEIKWNGSKYSSGVYFYKLIAGSFTATGKMILVK